VSETTKPVRVQRSRKKGWKMPPNTVSVARPSIFGNPWKVGPISAKQAVTLFRTWLVDEHALDAYLGEKAGPMSVRRRKLLAALQKLGGKNLACFCPLDHPCHADVLLEIANRGDA